MAGIRRDWITLAILLKARGLRGEIVADPLGSTPDRYNDLKKAWVFGAEESAPREVRIEEVWSFKGSLVFKFEGVDSIEDAQALEKSELRIPAAERPPAPEGEFYHSDLIGCEVFDTNGGRIGEVAGWQDHGASGLLEVKTAKGQILVPFAKSICVEIDPAARRIVIDPPEGLLDLV